jgi:hypothetical protein
MNTFFAVVAIITGCLYFLQFMGGHGLRSRWEYFSGGGSIADFNAGLLLQDILPSQPGLSGMGAMDCAAADTSRQGELGGQYVQRTNNYRRDYPDTCSAPLTEFVGSVYKPMELGRVVPCDGLC